MTRCGNRLGVGLAARAGVSDRAIGGAGCINRLAHSIAMNMDLTGNGDQGQIGTLSELVPCKVVIAGGGVHGEITCSCFSSCFVSALHKLKLHCAIIILHNGECTCIGFRDKRCSVRGAAVPANILVIAFDIVGVQNVVAVCVLRDMEDILSHRALGDRLGQSRQAGVNGGKAGSCSILHGVFHVEVVAGSTDRGNVPVAFKVRLRLAAIFADAVNIAMSCRGNLGSIQNLSADRAGISPDARFGAGCLSGDSTSIGDMVANLGSGVEGEDKGCAGVVRAVVRGVMITISLEIELIEVAVEVVVAVDAVQSIAVFQSKDRVIRRGTGSLIRNNRVRQRLKDEGISAASVGQVVVAQLEAVAALNDLNRHECNTVIDQQGVAGSSIRSNRVQISTIRHGIHRHGDIGAVEDNRHAVFQTNRLLRLDQGMTAAVGASGAGNGISSVAVAGGRDRFRVGIAAGAGIGHQTVGQAGGRSGDLGSVAVDVLTFDIGLVEVELVSISRLLAVGREAGVIFHSLNCGIVNCVNTLDVGDCAVGGIRNNRPKRVVGRAFGRSSGKGQAVARRAGGQIQGVARSIHKGELILTRLVDRNRQYSSAINVHHSVAVGVDLTGSACQLLAGSGGGQRHIAGRMVDHNGVAGSQRRQIGNLHILVKRIAADGAHAVFIGVRCILCSDDRPSAAADGALVVGGAVARAGSGDRLDLNCRAVLSDSLGANGAGVCMGAVIVAGVSTGSMTGCCDGDSFQRGFRGASCVREVLAAVRAAPVGAVAGCGAGCRSLSHFGGVGVLAVRNNFFNCLVNFNRCAGSRRTGIAVKEGCAVIWIVSHGVARIATLRSNSSNAISN